MKGRNPNKAEKKFHDDLCRIVGCIACRYDGVHNDYVSIHHIDGRTKPDAHILVLPLCGSHHQDMGDGTVSVHPWKSKFEARYAPQSRLLVECELILLESGVVVPTYMSEVIAKYAA